MFNIGSLVSSVRRLGQLTLEEQVAALNPTAWFDSVFAQSKIAVDLATASSQKLDLSGNIFGADGVNDPSWSISIWINPDTISSPSDGLISQQLSGGSNKGINIVYFDTTFYTQIFDPSAGVALLHRFTHPMINGNWYHVTVTYNGGGTKNDIEVTINGTKYADETGSTPGSYVAMEAVDNTQIGSLNNGSYYDGQLDQVLFFNKKLSDDEVSDLYNSGFGLNHSDLVGDETFYNDIVAWYDFNSIPNFGRDSHGESHAVSLDNSKTLEINTTTDLDFGDSSIDSPFSVSAWIYPTTLSGGANNPIVGKSNTIAFNCGNGGLELYLGDNGFGNTIYHLYNTGISVNNWYHVACTYDGLGSANGISLYINGSEVIGTRSSGGSYTAMHSSSQFAVGKRDLSVNFIGAIDEVAVYSDELTAGEVSTLYNNGIVTPARELLTTNLVSDWSFNEQDPAEIGKDSFGTNDLTPTSIVEGDLVGGKDSLDLTEISIDSTNAVQGHISGKAGDWEGVNKWADRSGKGNDATQTTLSQTPYNGDEQLNGEGMTDFGDGTSPVFLTPSSGTSQDGNSLTNPMSIWVLFNCSDIGPRQDFYYNEGYRLFFDGGGHIRFEMYDTLGIQLRRSTAAPTTFNSNEWTLIGVTYDGTHAINGRESITFYKNGTLADMSGNAASSLSGNYRNAGTRYFGTGGGQYRGVIADSSVYIGQALTLSSHALIKDYVNEKYNLSL